MLIIENNGGKQKCPECKKYSMEQMDNFKKEKECVATRFRCKYCLKDFAMKEPVRLSINKK